MRQDQLQAFGVCRPVFDQDGNVTGQERCMFGLEKVLEKDDGHVHDAVQILVENVLFCYNFVFADTEEEAVAALAQYNEEDMDLGEKSVKDLPECPGRETTEPQAETGADDNSAVRSARPPARPPARTHTHVYLLYPPRASGTHSGLPPAFGRRTDGAEYYSALANNM